MFLEKQIVDGTAIASPLLYMTAEAVIYAYKLTFLFVLISLVTILFVSEE